MDRDRTQTQFAAALAGFTELLSREDEHVAEEAHSRLLHHGTRTDRCYVLFHGFTNCPAQFAKVADALHERGANVLVPLAEGHGRADGSPHVLTELSPSGLAEWISETVTIASGLGDNVTVAGFSFGGVCASWAAVHLSVIDEAVIISPAFLPFGVPVSVAPLLPRLSRLLPERYMWWDPVRKEGYRGAPYSYRKLSRRGIGAVFELGRDAGRAKHVRSRPLARAVLVLNDNDMAVSAYAAIRSFERAVAPLAREAEIRRLDAKLRFPHDFIDPLGVNREREQEGRQTLLRILVREAVV